MNKKTVGAFLVGWACFLFTLDVLANEISNAILLAGFYAGNITGAIPNGRLQGFSVWVELISGTLLVALGTFFLLSPERSEKIGEK